MTFAAELAAARPDEIALRDSYQQYRWSDVDDYLRPAVNALQSEVLGAQRRAAVFSTNTAETLLAYVACTLAGTSAVAVNSHLTAREVAYILADAQADVVLCGADRAATAARAAADAGIGAVVAWGGRDLPDGVRAWQEWVADAGDAEPRTDLEPRRTLVYTSGTTGRPKGVELPHTSWVGGDDIPEHVRRLAGNRMIAYGRHLVVGPLYHSGPLTGTRLFLGGAPVTVLNKYDGRALLATIERDRVGSTIMVPTHFQRLLALPREVRECFDHQSLRYVLQVGATCPEGEKRAMIDWWGPIVWESYGASEVGTTCMISAQEWLDRPGSVGRSVPPFEAFIRGTDGTAVPPGVEGELWFRDTSGHGIAYISDPDSRGDTFTLGEIGRMDEDGYVWVTDRSSDMVVSGGVNIYPAEVEQVLIEHPRVADVACYGIPDSEMGECLVALVASPRVPPAEEELDAFARERIAGYKCPKAYLFTDALPRTAVGKLDKQRIRADHPISAPSGV